MRHSLLILALILFCVSPSFATPDLKVTLKDNQSIRIELSQKPLIEFHGNEISIGTNFFAIEDVVKYEFLYVDAEDVIESVTETDVILVKMDNETLKLLSLGKVSLLRVSDLKGVDLTSYTVKREGAEFLIDLSGLKSGVYVIFTDKNSFKINKK